MGHISAFFQWYNDESIIDMDYVQDVGTPTFQKKPFGVKPQH